MRLSTSASILLAACFSPLFFAACGSTPGDQNANFADASPAVQEFPFKTREPDVFQTEIVIRTGNAERRLSVARDGLKRRIDYDAGTDGHRAVITADDKQYLVFFKRRLYEERPLTAGPIPENELASHLTYTRDLADFEEVGREGPVVRFSARVNESETSEVIIFFDETIDRKSTRLNSSH